MTAEQLLIIARRFCKMRKVHIINYSALVAASAAAHARIDGIAVHDNTQQEAASLYTVLTKVSALSGHNKEFAHTCAQIYITVTNVA